MIIKSEPNLTTRFFIERTMGTESWWRKIYGYFKELGKITPVALVTTFLPIVGSSILLIVAIPLGNWLRANWEIGGGLYLLGIFLF